MSLKLLAMVVPWLWMAMTDSGGGDDPPPGAGEGGGGGDDPPDKPTTPAATSANKLIKDFAAARGLKVEDILTGYEKLEKDSKTETQRLTEERDRFKQDAEANATKYRGAVARGAVIEAATKAGAISPSAVYALAAGAVELDDDGKVTNLDAVLAAIKRDEPGLFRANGSPTDAGRAGDTSGEKKDVNAALRALKG